MNLVQLGDAQVDVCPNCEGSWYDADELADVIETPRAQLETTDLNVILEGDKLDRVDVEQPLLCPRCQQPMNRFRYLVTSEIWLDECPLHGVWLDDGELGKMQAFLKQWEQLDPETEARLQAEMERIKAESLLRSESFINGLCRAQDGTLKATVLKGVYRLFHKLGL